MADVLVTGGTGMLGRLLVPALVGAGHRVRVLSRRAAPDLPGGTSAVRGDLRTGEGVPDAVAGVDTVVHAATSPFRRTRRVDVEGTERLLTAGAAAGVRHVVFPSIVGVDHHPFPYYRAKRAAEQVVESGPCPWTIVRATQFHELLDMGFGRLSRLPVMPVARGFVFQPVSGAEVAARIVEIVAAGPSGRSADLGGPELLLLDGLARAWLRAHGSRRRVVRLPVPGRVGAAFRAGVQTCPDHADGRVTWQHFLGA
jgi:uncharacterized protein YbjT (DUF2867 family)